MRNVYVLQQPSKTLGLGYQAICDECGVLGHWGSHTQAQVAVLNHRQQHPPSEEERTVLAGDLEEAIKSLRQRQQSIEEALR